MLPGRTEGVRSSDAMLDGYRITAAGPEPTVSGAVATLTTAFDRNIVVGLRYGQ